MKILLTLLSLSAALLPNVASSADMPIKAPVYSVPASVSWSGMYVGINGGWNLGSFSPFINNGPDSTKINLDDNNPFVGGHIGYNVQNGNFVVGPEFGVQWWGFKSQDQLKMIVEEGPAPVVTFQQKIDWLAYANVRGGILVTPNVLAYITGGAAWAHVKSDVAIDLADLSTTKDSSVLGVNIGAGFELKLTDTIIFGGEYRHYDFGKVNAVDPIVQALVTGVGANLRVDQAMGRLSFKLN